MKRPVPKLHQKPELVAHARTVRLSFPDVVSEAMRLLGPANTLLIANVGESRALWKWVQGERTARDASIEGRLRLALLVAFMLEPFDSPSVICTWFTGLNPHLDDHTPLEVIRTEDPKVSGPRIMSAARAFIAHS